MPICGKPAKVLPPMGDRSDLDCSGTCGRYAISGGVEATLGNHPLDDREKALLAEWIAGQHREGKERPLISSYVLPAVIGRGG
jgi:hypothetical protein